jgi:hypothetical protein
MTGSWFEIRPASAVPLLPRVCCRPDRAFQHRRNRSRAALPKAVWAGSQKPIRVSAQKMHFMDATRQRQRKPGNWAGRTQVYIGIETEILEQSPKAVYPYQYRQLI